MHLVTMAISEMNTVVINYRLINNYATLEIFIIKYKLHISMIVVAT